MKERNKEKELKIIENALYCSEKYNVKEKVIWHAFDFLMKNKKRSIKECIQHGFDQCGI